MPDEQVIYRTHLHPVVYAGAVTLAIASVPVAVMLSWKYAGGMLCGAALWYAWCKVIVNTSEFAVTTKRVLIKTGFVARNAWEMHLSRIEGVQIDQDLFGRLLDYGTVIVKGVGGSSDPFKNISQPLDLRRAVVESMGGGTGEGKMMAAYQTKQQSMAWTQRRSDSAELGQNLVSPSQNIQEGCNASTGVDVLADRDRGKKTDPQSMAWTQRRSDSAELGQNLVSPSQNIQEGCNASTGVDVLANVVRTLNMLVDEYRRLRNDLDELRGMLLMQTQTKELRQGREEQAQPIRFMTGQAADKTIAGGNAADTDTNKVQFHKWEVPGRDDRGALIDKT